MTFYGVRKKGEDLLIFSMNPLLRGILLFVFFSLILSLILSMSAEEFRNTGRAGQINTVLMPLLFFLGSCYRYSLSFDRKEQTCTLKRGLVFLHRTDRYAFDDLTGLNYRIYDFPSKEGGLSFTRGLSRRERADFGFFFNGRLVQLEKSAPRKGVDVLYLTFTAYFPRSLSTQ